MKLRKILFLFITFPFLLFAAHSFALDTDLYIDSESTIEPNILIIFDNSGSMSDSPSWTSFCEYDSNYSYPQPTDPGIPYITPAKVYRKKSGQWIPLTVFKDSVSQVACSSARNALNWYGLYTGFTDSTCTTKSYTLATGNYLRWLYADPVNKDPCRAKIDIAKDVVKNFVNTITGVRIGLMNFNYQEGGFIKREIKSLDEIYDGPAGANKTHREHLIADINSLYPQTWTPLAETLYEAGLYFQGARSYFNSPPFKSPETIYTSPVQYYCQKNYVIIMTDGMSTQDQNQILDSAVGDRNSDHKEPPGSPGAPDYGSGSDYLDDVAKKHYDEDFHSMQGKQNISTYTIGFELDMSGGDDAVWAKDLLQRTATYGHGKFYTTSGAGGLADAFANILNEVLAKTSSFVAPIVPVSKMEKTTAGDKIYLAFFRPNQSGMWSGNIKKYGVAQTRNPSNGIEVGDILDVAGAKALDSNGAFYPSSKSYWTTSSSDGGEVEAGGVGEVLQKRDFTSNPRKIYTLLPGDADDEDDGPDSNTSFDLTHSWNAFTTANSRLTSSVLDVSSGDRDALINFVRGIDAYDDNLNGETTDKRDWMLGSFLHSRPHIIHYKDQTVIYAGANDGMLHAFRDSDGEELWAFIPPCFLKKLKYLHTETPPIFVDGSPKAYVTYDGSGNVTKAILIFGLRRGVDKDGKGYYYALDVTDPTAPKYLWRVYRNRENSGGSTKYYQDLGQTWSTPVIGKVAYGTGEKWVAIFGAGYDDEMDLANPDVGNITSGRGVYMADVLTGNCVWYHSKPGGDSTMTYPIASDVAPVDLDGDGRIDRFYVGDLNGRMWRFNIGDLNHNGNSDPDEWTAKIIFKSNPGTSEKRRIFYPPDVTFEKDSTGEYEMLFFGTGDREDPKGTKDVDRIYAFKDRGSSTTKGEADLVDVTGFYNLSADQQTAKINEIKSKDGWYIILDRKAGEKCLATPVVYNKTAYFTTFSPSTEAISDPCFVGEGTAALYAVNYATGEAAFNLDLTNDTGGTVVKAKSDRSTVIGSAIPSGVVITVIGGKVTAYIGVGGGVNRPTLSSSRSMYPVHWKLVF
jgi:type IV pilus assembly protein PilY1